MVWRKRQVWHHHHFIPTAKPKPTVRVSPRSSIYTEDIVTLSCELQESTGYEFLRNKYNQQLRHLSTEHTSTNTLQVTMNTAGETVYDCVAYSYNKKYYTGYSSKVRITAKGMFSFFFSFLTTLQIIA